MPRPGIGSPPLPRTERRLISVVWLHIAFAATGFGTTLLGLPASGIALRMESDRRTSWISLCVPIYRRRTSARLLVRQDLFRSIQQGYLAHGGRRRGLGSLHGYAAAVVFFVFGMGMGWAMTAINMVGGTVFERPGAALSLLNASWIVGAALSPAIAARWVRYWHPMQMYYVVALVFAGIVLTLRRHRASLMANHARRIDAQRRRHALAPDHRIFAARVSLRRRRSLREWVDDDLRPSAPDWRRLVGGPHHFLFLACDFMRPASCAGDSSASIGIAFAPRHHDGRRLQRSFDLAESFPGGDSSLRRKCGPRISAHISAVRVACAGAYPRVSANQVAFFCRRTGRFRPAVVDRQAFHAYRLSARRPAGSRFRSGVMILCFSLIARRAHADASSL